MKLAAPVLLACLVLALALAACGGGDDASPPGTRVEPKRVPFTFIVPDDFRNRKVRPRFSRGAKPLAVYALDPWNLVDVRKSAPRALPLDEVASQIEGSLEELGFPDAKAKRESHGGRDFVVFTVSNNVSGRPTTSKVSFFSGGGGTWEIECQSTKERADRVDEACDGVVRSIEFM
jgi:hypothetical protein